VPSWVAAFAVHFFTASGAALGLFALFAAVERHWTLMFWYLAAALLVDGIDGSIARAIRVAEALPRWSGDVLDLVVDFVTYVFVPAYAIASSGLLPDFLGVPGGAVIVVTGAIYFADRDMKTADNYFRGFPALWNAAAFYLFLLRPQPWISTAVVLVLAVATFLPFKFVHPLRVQRWRGGTLMALVLWGGLVIAALYQELEPDPWIAGSLAVLGLYFVFVGLTDRWPGVRER